ncbi:MAG: hypothetical protein CSA70_04060 [Rhodobacterales bacterium]|nr:MAG: hypothetical protein CSA70_04060 [Rhodobacterales bacterium]
MNKFAILLTACAVLLAPMSPVKAEEEGLSLMEEGARLFFKGIVQEMEPAIDDLRGFVEGVEPALKQFVEQMGPAFADLMGKIDDLNAYHPPELLPNGDIILRRKTPQEMDTPQGEQEEIEL